MLGTETATGAQWTAGPGDEEVVRRVLAGEPALFELLMRRHNQRVYRAIRAILKDEAEVEDTMQQAYLRAWAHLSDFAGTARFSTWLLRIAVNEALMRIRRTSRLTLVPTPLEADPETHTMRPTPSPEEEAHRNETLRLLQSAVDRLPDVYRSVFMLREVEGLDTRETAEVLSVSEDVVKTRLHRARTLLREDLLATVTGTVRDAFPFFAPRCDRVVEAVMAKIPGG